MYRLKIITSLLVLATISAGCGSLSADDQDQAVLESLREAGSDFTQAHPVDFYIYNPTKDGAEQICDQLRANGFKVSVREAATGSDWLCFASLSFVPSIDKLAEIRGTIEGLTEQFGGEYDGWETVVKPK